MTGLSPELDTYLLGYLITWVDISIYRYRDTKPPPTKKKTNKKPWRHNRPNGDFWDCGHQEGQLNTGVHRLVRWWPPC